MNSHLGFSQQLASPTSLLFSSEDIHSTLRLREELWCVSTHDTKEKENLIQKQNPQKTATVPFYGTEHSNKEEEQEKEEDDVYAYQKV